MADRLIRVLAACLALGANAVGAQTTMADPTRPPPGLLAPAPEAGEASGPVLQSVLLPKKGRPLAVIGGQQVRLGELYGDSRLIRLSEREAVLEGPEGIERLRLTPGVEKTNVASKNTAKTVTKDLKKAPASRPAQSEGRP